MKFLQLISLVVLLLTACSSPKQYSYHFDRYDYNSGRKSEPVVVELPDVSSPIVISKDDALTADLKNEPAIIKKEISQSDFKAAREAYKAMSKDERKAFRKAVVSELKEIKKVKKTTDLKTADGVESVKATEQFDLFSGLAIIFGGAGIVLITLANISNVFWIVGAISLVVGAVFFVKWVSDGNG